MSEKVSIRSCSIDDVNTLVSLGIQTFRDTFGDMNTPENMRLYLSQTFTHEKLARELEENGSLFFIAETENEPVGYAKIRSSKQPDQLKGNRCLEIERIYAIKEHIGKGVGRALMEKCIEHARENRFSTVWLGVWEHNTSAIQFYKKWGFEKFGQQDFMLGLDQQTDLTMKKQLD